MQSQFFYRDTKDFGLWDRHTGSRMKPKLNAGDVKGGVNDITLCFVFVKKLSFTF